MESIPTRTTPVLVIDDDEGLLSSIEAAMVRAGLPEPALLSDSRKALALIRKHSFFVVVLDLVMPHMNGLELLELIKKEFPSIECLIITATDDAASAVKAIKLGAYDYLVKPVDREKLTVSVQNALERYGLRQELSFFKCSATFAGLKRPDMFVDMVAADEAMARVFHQAEAVAPTDYSLLISGESGTGKELLARSIHRMSLRSSGPFVAVNMASFSSGLFETEFFGHARGAFTGAVSDKQGFYEAAHGGTLFLDEITELDIQLQAKLLRVMQESEFYRMGSTRARSADVRIIAATNKNMQQEIAGRRFRDDLYYRLGMFAITIPPLRARTKDILPLALHFVRLHASRNNKTAHSLSPDLEQAMLRYAWPGNVRELENVMSKAVLLSTSDTLDSGLCELPDSAVLRDHAPDDTFLVTLQELESRHIERVLDHAGGNKTIAARILGIDLRTLQRKLKKEN